MGDEGCSINLALGYEFQNFLAIAAIYASCLESEIFAIHLRERQNLRFIIEGNYCHYCIGTSTLPGQLKSVLTTCHCQYSVCTSMVAVLHDEVRAFLWCRQQYIGIVLLDEGASFF